MQMAIRDVFTICSTLLLYVTVCSCQCVFAGIGHIVESVITVVDGGVCCYLFFYHLSLLVSR